MRTLSGISAVPAADWNALTGPDQPALQHAFLTLLEATGAASPATGWTARHQIIDDSQGGLAAALPLYEKQHSFGEFVFDFALADAWHRSGLHYYPKLVTGIPFSPLIGPRLLGRDENHRHALAEAMEKLANGQDFSTAHALFCNQPDQQLLSGRGWVRRDGCRFLWQNRDYRDFDHWLEGFRSKKRKNLRRERRDVRERGIHFHWVEGEALQHADWEQLYPLYANTYHQRLQEPYLPRTFFEQLCREQRDSVLLIEARDEDEQLIAMAFCLKGKDTLYGRHWGALRDVDGLHFETCYHQGIEYCIERGLKYFDPGTQGEHKLLRGFEPVETWSMHWIPHPGLRQAVADFAAAEAQRNRAYMQAAHEHLPFHRAPGTPELSP